jgi:hypothetical protein
MRERDANILRRFIASFLCYFFFWQGRNPSWHCTRACHSIKKQPTSSLCRFHVRELNFHQISPVRRLSAFQSPITPFFEASNPGRFAKFRRLQSCIYAHPLLCGSIPAESELRRARAILHSRRKFIMGANSDCCSGVFCVYA